MNLNLESISKEHSLKVFSFTKEYFDFYWHFHPEYEITIILEGNGKRFIANHCENFSAQELVFIGSNIPHTWKSEALAGKEVKAIVIQFTENCILPILEISEFSEFKKWFLQSHFVLKIKLNEIILEKIKELEQISGAFQLVKFYEFLLLLSQQKNQKILSESYKMDYSKKQRRIHFVLDYLEHHFQNSCKINEVSELTNLSKSGFAKFFKNETGACFSQYINELRIKKAKQLLLETDQNIKEVYIKVGFENQAYFNRVFKEITSLSPKTYRNFHWK